MKTFTKSVRCLLTLILLTSLTGYAQTITTDLPDYAPGSTATFTGSGWLANETVLVTIQNLTTPICYNGLCCPHYMTADANGGFTLTWTVCQCNGDSLLATATGQTSNAVATVYFTDSQDGTACISSVVAVNGGCVVSSMSSGNQFWDVQENKIYTVTLSNATDVGNGGTDATIQVIVKNTNTGNQCYTATNPTILFPPFQAGVYTFDVSMPVNSCFTYPMLYGTSNCMSNTGVFAQDANCNPGGHLRAATFDGNCNKIANDESCQTTCIAPDISSCNGGGDLGCNPSSLPPAVVEPTFTGTNAVATHSDVTTNTGCAYTLTRTWTVTGDCGTATCDQTYTYQQATAPVFAGVPTGGFDLGCNPPSIPTCADYTVTASNECGTASVTCSSSDGGSGCAHSRSFTWTATASCGGSNTASVTYNWTEATALTFDNLPSGGYLGCNPTLPSCSTVTATNSCGTVTATCTPGNIEDNAVPNNLVVNGDFSAGNTGFSSAYTYPAFIGQGTLQPEGTYAVGANSNTFHNGFTGLGHSGNFMIVNGAGTPNTIVWEQTITVTPNTDYYFASWACNVDGNPMADLQFSINGSQIGGIFNPVYGPGVWTQFYQTWNSGSNTTALLRILDQNTTLGGNDFGLDDITFSQLFPSCGHSQTFHYHASTTCGGDADADVTYTWKVDNSAPSITCAGDVAQCDDGSNCITLDAPTVSDGCGGAITVSRSPSLSCYPVGTTVVVWTATDACGNTNTCSQSVTVYENPTVSLTPAGPVSACESQDCVTLTASASGGIPPYTYTWTGAEQVSEDGTSATVCTIGSHSVSVSVSDSHSCSGTSNSVEVNIHPNPSCGIDPLQYDVNNNNNWDEAELPVANSTGNSIVATYIAEPGSTLQWTSSNPSWPITGGQGTPTVYFTAGPIGTSSTFTLTVTSPYNCTSTCDITFTTEVHEQCAYTQGFYGSTNGQMTCIGLTAVPAIKQALGCNYPCPTTGSTPFTTCNPLVLGQGSRKVTVPCNANSAACLNAKMPSSGSPGALPNASIDICNATGNTWLNNQNRLKNTLLGQAITLNLNLRLFPGLANLHITTSTFTTYGREPGDCDPNSTSFVANNVVTKTIPQSVINCLGSNPLNNTVAKLRDLANRALGYTGNGNPTCAVLQCTGTCTPPSFSDITAALTAINEGFDACRFISGFNVRLDNVSEALISGESTMVVYPNPASGITSVEFLASSSSNATVGVYNVNGSLTNMLFNEAVTEGSAYKVNFNSATLAPGIYFVRLVVGNEVTVNKLVVIQTEK